MALVEAWTTIGNLNTFRWLERSPVTQLQMQAANSRNRTTGKGEHHIRSIVRVQTAALVPFRSVRCHQIKKRHHVRLLLSKVFADLEKVLSLEWRNHHGKSSIDEEVEELKACPEDPG